MLKVVNLTKSFDGICACSSVSFSVMAGNVFCISGPNGSGKSTLINLIAGEIREDSGTVMLGNSLVLGCPWHRRALGLGRSFQWPKVFVEWSVRQNLEFACSTAKSTEPLREAKQLREIFGLDEAAAAEKSAHAEQKLLNLSLSFAGKPKVLLLDEPCAGLILPAQEQVRKALCWAVNEWSPAIVIVDHSMRFLADVLTHLPGQRATMINGLLTADEN